MLHPGTDPLDIARAFHHALRDGARDVAPLLGPDFHYEPDALLGDGRRFTSLSDWLAWIGRRYTTYNASMREFIVLPGDRVLAIGTVDLHGPHGGFGSLASWFFEIRDGRIVRLECVLDQPRARRKAGLRGPEWPSVARFVALTDTSGTLAAA